MDNDTMVAVTLKPCPWCGGEASADGYIKYSKPLADTWWEGGAPITEAFFVNCMKCGAVSRSGLVSGYQTKAEAIAAWNTRHQSGRTGAGERETVARVIHQCLRPVNMANADWDSGAILGADNSWRRSVYSTADHILAALSQSTAGEDGA